MIEEVTLPELGENIETATAGTILVGPGDRVQVDQGLMEVETEKATAELPSPVAGVIAEVRVQQGEQVRVGQVVFTVETAAEKAPTAPSVPAPAEKAAPEAVRPSGAAVTEGPVTGAAPPAVAVPPAAPAPPTAAAPPAAPAPPTAAAPPAAPAPTPAAPPAGVAPVTGPVPPEVRVAAAPAARRLARELGVDITGVQGTGPGNRVSLDDVKRAARAAVTAGGAAAGLAAPAGAPPTLPDFTRWGEVQREPMSSVRRATAEKIARAWQQVAHVTQQDRADVTELDELRRDWAERVAAAGGKLTMTAMILKVAAAALVRFPRFNASLDLAAREIVYKRYVNLGVAVDTDRGLLVPVIRDADSKSITRIAVELTELSRRAREKNLTLDEMRGATFSITNLGGLGTTYFTPIVAWPEVAILGIGRATREAVWREGGFVPRLVLPLSVSYDHRIIDGADAARFLRWVAEALEQPLRLIMED